MDEELEQLLGRYRPAGPQNAMRNEVLTGMKRRAWWLRARGVAAVLLVAANVGMIGASVWRLQRPTEGPDPDHLARQVEALQLPVSAEESDRLAHLLAAAGRQRFVPELHGHASLTTEEMP